MDKPEENYLRGDEARKAFERYGLVVSNVQISYTPEELAFLERAREAIGNFVQIIEDAHRTAGNSRLRY